MMYLGLRTILMTTVLGLGTAFAADLPSARPAPTVPLPVFYDWNGVYVGINGGGAFGQSRHDEIVAPTATTGTFSVRGGEVGGTVGYNWQRNAFVLGGEGDMDWARSSGSVFCPNSTFICSTKSSYLGTARGRIGYAAGAALFYATGGAAFGDIRQSFQPPFNGVNGSSASRVGWAVGGGMEYGFAPNWSAKIEYLHVDLGRFTCGFACSGVAGEIIAIRLNENVVRAGLNYRFTMPFAAPVIARY